MPLCMAFRIAIVLENRIFDLRLSDLDILHRQRSDRAQQRP
jgi:hypothetical protein